MPNFEQGATSFAVEALTQYGDLPAHPDEPLQPTMQYGIIAVFEGLRQLGMTPEQAGNALGQAYRAIEQQRQEVEDIWNA